MTPQEFYDNLMEVIHQFPLDANNFERYSRRTAAAYSRYFKKFKKIINNISDPEDKKFIKIKKKLENLIGKKRKQVIAFENCIDKHMNTVEEYCKTCDEMILFSQLPEVRCSVIKIEENLSDSVNKYCSCNENAFGMMVRCDNPGCEIKWFHYKCVGLNASPRTEWMCMNCRKDMSV